MSYAVRLEQFEGPLDLLLRLVEAEKLEITTIALIRVTEPFLRALEDHERAIPPEEVADFLVIAAKLVYLKSKAILPDIHDPSLEEGPDLAEQLRTYKTFVDAAARLAERLREDHRCFSVGFRSPVRSETIEFIPPRNISIDQLASLYRIVVKRLEPVLRLPHATVERIVTIEQKIQELYQKIRVEKTFSFHRFASIATSRSEMIVAFLAVLELTRKGAIRAHQGELFQDIHIESTTV